jgi:DNA-binding ferritin-like protein (Dps family)
MGLNAFCYYGRIHSNSIPSRLLVDDLIMERNQNMMQEMKEMEDRLKRHITECKREVIKEIQRFLFNTKPPLNKEVKHDQ